MSTELRNFGGSQVNWYQRMTWPLVTLYVFFWVLVALWYGAQIIGRWLP